jgi:ribosomal-protein-serine acetyltransferase
MLTIPLVIPTGREDVSLRQFVEDDAGPIFRLIDSSREHLSQWGDPTAEKYPTEESVLESIRRPIRPGRLRMAIRNKNEIVGSVNLQPLPAHYHAEIGYWLGKEYAGHGFMTLAVHTMVGYAFDELEYFYLKASARRENVKSQAVLERVGFHITSEADIYLNYQLRAIDWVA